MEIEHPSHWGWSARGRLQCALCFSAGPKKRTAVKNAAVDHCINQLWIKSALVTSSTCFISRPFNLCRSLGHASGKWKWLYLIYQWNLIEIKWLWAVLNFLFKLSFHANVRMRKFCTIICVSVFSFNFSEITKVCYWFILLASLLGKCAGTRTSGNHPSMISQRALNDIFVKDELFFLSPNNKKSCKENCKNV